MFINSRFRLISLRIVVLVLAVIVFLAWNPMGSKDMSHWEKFIAAIFTLTFVGLLFHSINPIKFLWGFRLACSVILIGILTYAYNGIFVSAIREPWEYEFTAIMLFFVAIPSFFGAFFSTPPPKSSLPSLSELEQQTAKTKTFVKFKLLLTLLGAILTMFALIFYLWKCFFGDN